jgi:O-antigen/teichoic acid export membrane protein
MAGQAALIVSGVLVARLLGVENRGHLALMALSALVFATLGGLGVPLAATYQIARAPHSASAVVRFTLRLAILQAAAVLAIQIAFSVAVFSGDGEDVALAAGISTLGAAALVGQQLGVGLLQGSQRLAAFNALRLLPAVLYSAGLVALALGGAGDLVACAAAWTVASLISAAATLAVATRATGGAAPVARFSERELLRFGRRGLLGSAFPVETFQLDQFLVGLALGPAALGLYVAGAAFVSLPRFLAQSLGMVAYPRIASTQGDGARRRLLRRYVLVSAALCATIVCLLELVIGDLIELFFGAAFAPATEIARVLLLGGLFVSVRRVLADSARGLGHPELGTIAEVASWIALAVALPLLLDEGPRGVATAMAAAYAFSLAVLAAAVRLRSPGEDEVSLERAAVGRVRRRREPAQPEALGAQLPDHVVGERLAGVELDERAFDDRLVHARQDTPPAA